MALAVIGSTAAAVDDLCVYEVIEDPHGVYAHLKDNPKPAVINGERLLDAVTKAVQVP